VSELAYLGLGSNLGERLDTLQHAVDLLAGEPGVRPSASSRVWETDPVGGPPQPDYLNVVLRVDTDLTPFQLLDACQRTERALGREREMRWGPRTIDIDLLLFGDQQLDVPLLTVPHPRMTSRAFALLPLLELEPDACLPDGTRLVDIPLGPDAAGGARPFAPPLAIA
jgi:2-amino-4-hydroxy-6-hydroxymethyldihydropteridine diphosphokinase